MQDFSWCKNKWGVDLVGDERNARNGPQNVVMSPLKTKAISTKQNGNKFLHIFTLECQKVAPFAKNVSCPPTN